MASVRFTRGELDDAASEIESSLISRRRLGDKWGVAESLQGAARVERARGQLEAALSMFQECLELQKAMTNKQGILDALEGLGGVALDSGDAETAAALFGAADEQREEIGAVVPPRYAEQYDRDRRRARELLGAEGFDAVCDEARARGVTTAVERGLAITSAKDPARNS